MILMVFGLKVGIWVGSFKLEPDICICRPKNTEFCRALFWLKFFSFVLFLHESAIQYSSFTLLTLPLYRLSVRTERIIIFPSQSSKSHGCQLFLL